MFHRSRTRHKRRILVLSLLAAGVVWSWNASPSYARDSEVALPNGAARSIALDELHSHLIVADNPVVVMDYSGAVVATLPDEVGRVGLLVDGDVLYIAQCSLPGVIDIIDTNTLARIGQVPIPDGIGATQQGDCRLAIAGGRLWFDTADAAGTLGSMAVGGTHDVVTYSTLDPVDNALFATTPTNKDLLVIASSKYCPSTVQVYDVSGATPNVVMSTVAATECMRDMKITPDGTMLLIAGPVVEELRLADLSGVAGPPIASYATSVAESADIITSDSRFSSEAASLRGIRGDVTAVCGACVADRRDELIRPLIVWRMVHFTTPGTYHSGISKSRTGRRKHPCVAGSAAEAYALGASIRLRNNASRSACVARFSPNPTSSSANASSSSTPPADTIPSG